MSGISSQGLLTVLIMARSVLLCSVCHAPPICHYVRYVTYNQYVTIFSLSITTDMSLYLESFLQQFCFYFHMYLHKYIPITSTLLTTNLTVFPVCLLLPFYFYIPYVTNLQPATISNMSFTTNLSLCSAMSITSNLSLCQEVTYVQYSK